MKIKFLGTNGWHSNGVSGVVCTALFAKDRIIVMDAGGAFWKLSAEVNASGIKHVDIFISHLHLDHCAGLHTLAKLPIGTRVRIFIEESQEKMLKILLDHPFTARPGDSVMKADVSIIPFKAGWKTGYFTSLALDHADPSFGFRFELEGKTVAYCLDSGPCEAITELAKGADVLITECSLLPGAKMNPKWPHMNPALAARQALTAKVKTLVLTHFGSDFSKEDRERSGKAAREIFKNTIIAYDGEALEV